MNLKEFKLQILLLDYTRLLKVPYYTTYTSTVSRAPQIVITRISICVKGECYSIKEDAHEAFARIMEYIL